MHRQHAAFVALQLLSLAVIVVAPYCDRRGIAVVRGLDPVRYGGIALTALSIPILLWRIRDEEALLATEFGKDWEVYRVRTRRLIPFLY